MAGASHQPGSQAVGKDLNALMEDYTSKLEQKVAYESQYFRLMADAMPQIVWTATPDGMTDYLNQRWYDYSGLDEASSLGDGWLDIIHPDDVQQSRELWKRAVADGEQFQVEYRFKDKSTAGYRWFLGRALPGRDSSGRILKWFGTCTDIDEHKKTQEKKDEFLAIASHELKTPVTSIKAFAQIIQRRLKAAGQQELVTHIERMDTQIDKLSSLIGDLLDITTIDSGKLELKKVEIDLDQFIVATVQDQQPINPKHRLKIEGKAKCLVAADPNRLEQILINLIVNAVKYSPHSDQVVIRVKATPAEVLVGVQDFGLGIPAGQQASVFDRFFRVSAPGRETFPGLGLGLYISAEIVRRHGGRIWLESQEGQGSTFFFALPLAKRRSKATVKTRA